MNNQLSDDLVEYMHQKAEQCSIDDKDPWSMVKMQARIFLNSSDEVMKKVIDSMHFFKLTSTLFFLIIYYIEVESKELLIEKSINRFCAEEIIMPLVNKIANKNDLVDILNTTIIDQVFLFLYL